MNYFHPKVSIVIPVYNGSNYLGEAIDSALAQTYENIEIIVINDGSTDGGATEKIAKSYGDKIRYYKKENGGVATALNLGIYKMKGDYFSWLSHDDIYKPQKIQKQVEYLQSIPDKDVILFSNYSVMDENGVHQYNCILDHAMLEKKPIYALLRGNVNGITMLIPKTAFDEHGDFDTSLRCTQDYDMWYRMIKTYKFVHMKDILSTTRVHSLQDTQSNPRVISEGNELWVSMVEGLSDDEKRAAEGTVYKFYLEMTKFARQTPYAGALKRYNALLEDAVQSEETTQEAISNPDLITTVFKELIGDDQRKAASYYISAVVKRFIRAQDTARAASILLTNLNGEAVGQDVNELEKEYILKVLKPTNKPRIMFSSGHWLTGGMERVMSILFDQLKDDYELFLLTAYDGRESKIELPKYVTHIKVSNDLFYTSFDCVALSHALILDIDVAVGIMNLFAGQLDFYKLSMGTGIKTIASNHETYFYPYSNPVFYELVQERLDSYASVGAVLWLTNNSAATYGLRHNNSYLMPNPNTYEVQTTVHIANEKNILCVGRFNDYVKRVDRILKTFSAVSKVHPDAKLVLVGKYDMNAPIRPNDETTLADLIQELNIDMGKIEFVGEVSSVEDYYKKAAVLLLTSTSEGFGMVINEAACFGVPTVCNKIPGLEDLITNGENGYLTDQGDIAAMADAVSRILSDDKLHIRLSENARKMVSRFNEVEIGKKWKYLINTLLEKSPDTSEKLSKALAYEVSDYEDFSKVLFDEMNKAVRVSYKERTEFLRPKYESTISFISKKAKSKYTRLNKSLKTNGILFTGKIIAKKTYHKVRRVYKRI